MFKEYGFQTPAEGLATSADEAVQLAGEIGFPVVLKIASPDILHKTDIGGVVVNLGTTDEVRQGCVFLPYFQAEIARKMHWSEAAKVRTGNSRIFVRIEKV